MGINLILRKLFAKMIQIIMEMFFNPSSGVLWIKITIIILIFLWAKLENQKIAFTHSLIPKSLPKIIMILWGKQQLWLMAMWPHIRFLCFHWRKTPLFLQTIRWILSSTIRAVRSKASSWTIPNSIHAQRSHIYQSKSITLEEHLYLFCSRSTSSTKICINTTNDLHALL